MGLDPVTLAAASLAVSTVGAAASYQQQKKAASAQGRAQAAQLAMQEAQARRERRDAIRQARITQANIIQAGETAGAAESSSVSGGVGAIGSQLGYNLGFQDQQMSLQRQQSSALQAAANYQTRAQGYGAVSSVFNQAFQQFDGYKTLFKAANSPKPPPPTTTKGGLV